MPIMKTDQFGNLYVKFCVDPEQSDPKPLTVPHDITEVDLIPVDKQSLREMLFGPNIPQSGEAEGNN